MNLIGKTTINPFIFYSGKISGYITWVLYLLSLTGLYIVGDQSINILAITSYLLTAIGLILIVISLVNLGKSTRLGIPDENTEFKNSGIYKFSRNPMYVGFNLLTLSSMLFTANIFIVIMGVYSVIVYHLIIRGEEAFLEERFGDEYLEYKKKVRRYI
jgi:protein-S-isoprenylcysteine O-methyltransferase Ste14